MSYVDGELHALQPALGDVADFIVTSAGTQDGLWLTSLFGVRLLTCQVRFLYGTGSGGVRVFVQSSMDGGLTAFDVAVLEFAAAARNVRFAILAGTTGLLEPGLDGVTGDSPTVSEAITCPLIGDRLKARVQVIGTYANTTVSVRILATP